MVCGLDEINTVCIFSCLGQLRLVFSCLDEVYMWNVSNVCLSSLLLSALNKLLFFLLSLMCFFNFSLKEMFSSLSTHKTSNGQFVL